MQLHSNHGQSLVGTRAGSIDVALLKQLETATRVVSTALTALAEAEDVSSIKKIRGDAEAIRAWARNLRCRDLEIDAAEIRLRAERQLGQMIAQQKATFDLAKGGAEPGVGRRGKKNKADNSSPTLAEAGIDKHLADRARKLAQIPKDEFDGHLIEWRGRMERSSNE